MNIVILFRTRNILDDFREAYFWLRQNTDEHTRVMSWWDYGYQIAGMANRTTLVDNNTWNNSHIALVRTWLTEGQKLQTVIHYLDIRLHLWLSRKTGGESAFCLLNFQHTSLHICSVKWFNVCLLIWFLRLEFVYISFRIRGYMLENEAKSEIYCICLIFSFS